MAMAKKFTTQDEIHMRRAMSLAARAQGLVEPNPMVGCVIARGRRIVGEGYHRKFGDPHAEVNALRQAGSKAKGAACYVTLEPCNHHGKTPPCTNALIEAGIGRVIAAMRDPCPLVRGRGLSKLRRAGIDVAVGLLEQDAMTLNAAYLKLKRSGRPWVILKWAQSLDGKIATRTYDSKWISCEQSRRYTHRIRGRVDAIIIGVSTVIQDNPLLTCRLGTIRRLASRIVIDPKLRTPKKSQLVHTARQVPTIIVTDQKVALSKRAIPFQRASVEVLGLKCNRAGLNLGALLDELGRRQMTNVMVEGGGKTLGAFFDADLADEAIVFVAPRLIGGESAISPLTGRGHTLIKDLKEPTRTTVTRCGKDHLYRLLLTKPTNRQ